MSNEQPSHEEVMAEISLKYSPEEIEHNAHLTEIKSALQMVLIMNESPDNPAGWITDHANEFSKFIEMIDTTNPEELDRLLLDAQSGKTESTQTAWNEYSRTLH